MLVLLLSGCSVLESYDESYDNLGKKIVAEWQQLPQVAAASYDYRHGLDLGQHLSADVMLHADAISEPAIDEVVEVVRRNCGRLRDECVPYTIYSTDDPPYADKPGSGEPVRRNVPGRTTVRSS